jgi:hypothetical protein
MSSPIGSYLHPLASTFTLRLPLTLQIHPSPFSFRLHPSAFACTL